MKRAPSTQRSRPRWDSEAARWQTQHGGLMHAMRELYREHTPEEIAEAEAACLGPTRTPQGELELKARS